MSTKDGGVGALTNRRTEVISPFLAGSMDATGENDLMHSYVSPSLDISGFTPDMSIMKEENRLLKDKIRQLQNDLQGEQDNVYSIRKKLNAQEKERLDSVAKLNTENSQLDCELTKVRAQLERGEATRQGLEYELAKARKEIQIEKKAAGERENLITEINESMKNKVAELTSQVSTLCEELEHNKTRSKEEGCRLRNIIMEKDQTISEYRTDKDAHDTERDRMEAAITQKDKRILDLEDKIQELEAKDQQNAESLRQQMSEMELLRDKDERLRREYEHSLERVRSLEESIEAERAAHLESKFNSEIVQLRIRDLENALELEKTTKAEVITGSDKLNKQIRELKRICEEERRTSQLTREKLEKNWQPILRAEKEYAALNKQLHHELEDKRLVIQKLSTQLDVHQKNFDELKQELNKAKKRQIYLEETYTGSINEMELLLTNFSFDPATTKPTAAASSTTGTAGKKKAPAGNKTKKEPAKSQSLAVLQESMRHLLIEYRRKLEEAKTELSRVKILNESLTKENQQNKDMLWAKDKAMESTQQAMSRTSKELRKSQTECQELDALHKQKRDEIDSCKEQLEVEKKANKALSDQINKLANKRKSNEKVSLEFMQTLYQQLQSANKTLSKSAPSNPQPKDLHSWTDLALYINDQVATVLTDLRRTQDKVSQLDQALAAKDLQLENVQATHQKQLDELNSVTEGRTHEWLQQKGEMEKHYANMLSDINSRQKKTQTLADQAWEKVRVTGSVQQGLETECSQLRAQVARSQKEQDSLLAACALLCGTLYPLYTRYATLAAQRNHLVEQLNSFQIFKQEVQALVNALSEGCRDEPQRDSSESQKTGRGLMRFRKSVLVVLMANRLAHSAKGNCKLFSARDALPGLANLMVCTGNMEPIDKSFTGVSSQWANEGDQLLKHGQELALAWLSSGDLLTTILSTMSDLQSTLQKARQGDSSINSSHIVSASRTCFHKLLCQLPCMFSTLQQTEVTSGGSREKCSLVKRLEYGLARVVAGSQPETFLASSQSILRGLQEQVLGFTQRLHTAEVERRDLRVEVTSLRQQQETWTYQAGSLDKAAEEVLVLRKQVENTVQRDRFENVCEELNNALKREQKAQHLLNEQSQQIHEMSARLEIHMSEDNAKEHTLGQAVKGLTEAKMELKRQEQRFRQQNKQLSLLEEEKVNLQEHVRDAENALKTAARDRDSTTSYMKNVEKALESIKSHMAVTSTVTHKPDFSRLLSIEMIPSNLGKTGPDFAACQRLVTVFVECQRQLNAQITALQGELRSHKEHIGTLKKELNAACRREFDDELEKIKLGDFNFDDLPTKLPLVDDDQTSPHKALLGSNHSNDFAPLIEDTSDSITAPDKHTPPKKEAKAPKTGTRGASSKKQSSHGSRKKTNDKTADSKA